MFLSTFAMATEKMVGFKRPVVLDTPAARATRLTDPKMNNPQPLWWEMPKGRRGLPAVKVEERGTRRVWASP